MKKILTFLLIALLTFAVGWAETVTITMSAQGWTNGQAVTSVSSGNVEITFDKGSNPDNNSPKYYDTGSGVRLYRYNTMTVTAGSSNTITGIQLTFASGYAGSVTSDGGDYSLNNATGTWSGSANSVTFTNESTSIARLQSVTVTYSSGAPAPTCATPTFSPGSGTYSSTQNVTISSTTSGATIYYTTDNTTPTTSSSSISNGGTVEVAQSCTLKAIAAAAGYNNSGVGEASYIISSGGGSGAIYSKITSANDLTTGNYLIVYETGNVAFDGSLTSLDGVGNTKSVTINNNQIVTDDAIYFTYDAAAGTLKSASGYYIGRTTNSNGMNTSQTDSYTHTITFDSGNAVITSSGGPTIRYNSASNQLRFRYYSSGQQAVQLYKRLSSEPELIVGVSTLALTDIPYDGSSTSGSFTVTGSNLSDNVSVSVSGDGFSVSPTSITPSNGSVNQEITVIYNGTSTTEVTGTVTITCGNLTETVTVTAKKQTPPAAQITLTPATQTINDSAAGSLTATGSYVSGNINASLASNTDWYLNPTSFSNEGGTMSITYTGRALSASNTVTAAAANDNSVSASATVNYLADLYIVTDNGVTNQWDFTNGTQMTYNNGVYTGTFTASVANTYILFARRLGSDLYFNDNSPLRELFGPSSNGDWWLPTSGNGSGSLDFYDDDPIKIQVAGTYNITINANNGQFTITAVTIGSDDFVLVTSNNEIDTSSDYVLVYTASGTDHAMSSSYTSSYYGQVTSGFTHTGNIISLETGNSVNILTLEDAGNDSYYIKDKDGYYVCLNGNSNAVHRNQTNGATDAYKWNISINGSGDAVIQNVSITSRYLRYNNGSPRYACYNSTNNIFNAKLYRRGVSVPSITVEPSSMELVIPAGSSSQSGTATVTERNTTGTTTVTISTQGANHFDAVLDGGTLTVIYNGTATSDNPDQATITVANGDASATVNVTGYKLPMTVTITPATGYAFTGSTMNGTIVSNVAGATIEYSFDQLTWYQYDENTGFTATVNTVGGTVTVYARATYGDEIATDQATYTREAISNTLYTKVTDISQIQAGNKYVIVFETTPQALNGVTSGGTGVDVAWDTQGSVVDIAHTNAIPFTLGGTTGEWTLSYMSGSTTYYLEPGDAPDLELNTTSSNNKKWSITSNNGGYVLTWGNYMMRYNSGASEANGRFRIYDGTTGTPVYLYVQGGALAAPVIMPASGTFYDDVEVKITDATTGATIWYTTDGSDPATSETRQVYDGAFNVDYTAGGTTTITAVAYDGENVSDPTTVTYIWGLPTVTITPGTTNVTTATTLDVVLSAVGGDDAVIYYTTDGSNPTTSSNVYSDPLSVELNNVGDEIVIKAIVVSDGYTSSVVTATYKYVENTVDMIDPFFSPMCNLTYYGNQTVEILCPIPGALMYYEINSAPGTVVPDASTVAYPSRGSNAYNSPIELTEGNAYYIKAVAYVGNSVSSVIEGWYIIRPVSEWTNQTSATIVLDSVAQLHNVESGSSVTFRNPVQVVYMSKFTNDPAPAGYSNPIPEFCYVRDNSGYGLIYFGKGATEWAEQTSGRANSPATIFKMGDWINGSLIQGTTGTWASGLIPQLGTNNHVIYSWPDDKLGNTRIMAEPTTCQEVNDANTTDNNLCGHYLHLRNTTIYWSEDQNPSTGNNNDPRNFGRYTDGTADASMYDRFWLFSGTNQSYTYSNKNYTIKGVGDYNTEWFNWYQAKNATFDIFAIGAYYTGNFTHDGVTEQVKSEILPIDYLWIYPPRIVTSNENPYEGQATITIEYDTVSWSNNTPTIYYRTDEMEDWAVYEGPFDITTSTTVYTYVELPAVKSDGTDYSDFVRSNVVEKHFTIVGIDDPVIDPASKLVDITDGPQTQTVTVTTGSGCTSTDGVYYTVYTTDGTTPYWNSADDYNGTIIEGTAGTFNTFSVNETTTVTAITYYVIDGEVVLVSNVESETYTFVKKNGVTYNILTDAPQVGTIVVIVNKANNMAMSTTQNEMNRGSVGVIFTDDTKDVVYGNDEIAQFVVESAGTNRYYLKNVNGGNPGYLYVNYTNANLLTESTLDGEGKAVTNINVGPTSQNVNERYIATVTFAYEGTTRYLRYYNGNHVFSTYGDATIHDDIFLYGIEATPLSYIEENKHRGDHVVVSDQLVGTWAVNTVVDGKSVKLLWVKDQGDRSIIPTYNENNDLDYMKEMWPVKPQVREWDQSNWAVIDFSNQPTVDPQTYVNKVIKGSTIIGTYTDELNYTITLDAISAGGVVPEALDGDADGYYGYLFETDGDPLENQELIPSYHYNQYIPVNFLEKNLFGNGKAGEHARAIAPGTPMFFMNPKIMEVVHVWGVYAGDGRFDIYENVGSTNGFDLEGAFDVIHWNYNRLSSNEYGQPEGIEVNKDYSFHAVVMRQNYGYGYVANTPSSVMFNASAMGSAVSPSLGIYPLDLPSGDGAYTSVKEVAGVKTVKSVRYYNIMGMESQKPFEGLNIVVTTYTDGTRSTVKVMK